MNLNKFVVVILMTLCYANSFAEETILNISRPTTSAYSIEWGHSSILDTYLSPMKYSGHTISISGQWSKAMRQNPQKLIMTFDISLISDINKNQVRNSYLYALNFNFAWNMQYRWLPIQNLQLSAGGGASLNAGALYLRRNSNNPVSAKASVDLTLNAMAAYSFKIGRLPLRLIDQLSLPSLGLFFSPGYGQTYYEIYLGNHSGLIHCGWWGNHFRLNNLIATDIMLGSINLRIGYRLNMHISYVNNINTQIFRHSLVVGIVSDWLNISNNSSSQSVNIPSYF